MKKRNILWGLMTIILVVGMLVVPLSQGGVSAQTSRPEPVSPAEGDGTTDKGSSSGGLTLAFATGGFQAAFPGGGNRLVSTQKSDGGWAWPLFDIIPPKPTPTNTIGPIAMGLAQAFDHTANTNQKAALKKAGDFLLDKIYNFSPSDGYLAAKLDQVFGGSAYKNHVKTYYYDPLAGGTYKRGGVDPEYDTAGYVTLIRNSRTGDQANIAAWDLGMGLVGAAMAGAATVDWVAGVKDEINELEGDNYYDVIGLAGAVYGLAYVGVDFDPTSGEHMDTAGSVSDLADILAGYQIGNGGFAWNSAWVIPDDGNEATQETAYAILALNEVSRTTYLGKIQGASDYLIGDQLSTGGWEQFSFGENNELTGEALWGISTGYPEVWVCKAGNCGHPGFSFNKIQDGINAVDVGGIVNVLPGTYLENQVTISKAVTVRGAGAAVTTIDGGSATLTNSGLVRIVADGNVTFSGFTLKKAGKAPGGTAGVIIGIFAQSATPGITFTISNNVILGSNNDAEEDDYGFYSSSNAANLVFTRNKITQTGANNMVLELHSGSSEVSFNTLDCGVYGADSFFDMTYNGLDVTAPQKVHHNTINLGTGSAPTQNCTGVTFASDFGNTVGNGKFTNVEIKYNNITNVKAYRRGIGLWNGDGGAGTGGDITNAQIIGNKITGISPIATGSKGIQLINLITNAVIKNNVITSVDYAFHGRVYAPGTAYPTGTTITSNAFTNSNIFQWDDPTNTLTAELNWWGSVTGPTHATNIGGTGIPVSNNVDFTPWALGWSAGTSASTHEIGETATLESNIYGNGVYGAQLRVDHDGTVLAWASGTANDVSSTPPWAWDFLPENFVPVTDGIRVSGTMLAPDHIVGADLTGQSIATWKYTCAAVGYSDLLYNTEAGFGTYLSNINGFEIPIVLTGDWVDCQISTASVKGYIKLQGRLGTSPNPRAWHDATVTLACVSSECAGYGPYFMTTNDAGYYELVQSGPGTGIALGTYSASVARRAYLGATKASDVTIISGMNEINTLLTAPTLLGGEVTGDGVIGLGDLTMIGGVFGTSITPDTGADVNGDGFINIFDLVLAGGNYGQISSTWSP